MLMTAKKNTTAQQPYHMFVSSAVSSLKIKQRYTNPALHDTKYGTHQTITTLKNNNQTLVHTNDDTYLVITVYNNIPMITNSRDTVCGL